MIKPKIAVVTRSKAYSPNNVNSDTRIISLVADNLCHHGFDVNIYDEDSIDVAGISEPVIVNMCRRADSIKALQDKERAGCLVINSGFGIENSTRENMTVILEKAGVPVPRSLIVDTWCEEVGDMYADAGFGRAWIKRGDGHSLHKEDVSFVRHVEEAQEVLAEYRLRGIGRAVISRHVEGDLVKFYGVADSDFFFTFYPLEEGHSKFGQEEVNGASHYYRYDRESLYQWCQKAAKMMNIDVFGGDCIIDGNGRFSMIDFNDWPSFSPCRVAGANAIARLVMEKMRQHFNNDL